MSVLRCLRSLVATVYLVPCFVYAELGIWYRLYSYVEYLYFNDLNLPTVLGTVIFIYRAGNEIAYPLQLGGGEQHTLAGKLRKSA